MDDAKQWKVCCKDVNSAWLKKRKTWGWFWEGCGEDEKWVIRGLSLRGEKYLWKSSQKTAAEELRRWEKVDTEVKGSNHTTKEFFVAFLKFLFNISFALISLFSLQNFKLVASLLTGVIVSGSFSCQRPPEMSSEDHAKISIEI